MKSFNAKRLMFLVPERKAESIKALYPGKTNKEIREKLSRDIGRKMLKTIALSLAGCFLIVISVRLKKTDVQKLVFQREDINGTSRLEQIILFDGTKDYPLDLEIHPILISDEEIDEMHTKVCRYLDEVIASDGSFSISEDIELPNELEGYPIDILWTSEDPLLLRPDGTVQNDGLKEPEDVIIFGKVSYGSEFRTYERTVTVLPPDRNDFEQKAFEAALQIRELEKAGQNEPVLSLPEEIMGFSIKLPEEKQFSMTWACFLLITFSLVCAYYLYFNRLEEQKKKKMKAADAEYKNFISKLTLLLSAGLTVRSAMNRLSKEYSGQSASLLSKNLEITVSEIENGAPESRAYEGFGDRMGSVRYKRLSSVLCQAVTKGVRHIEDVMIRENEEATAEEKEAIRIRGENAGTKLLFPMMGFLIIVFAILLVPAFRSF